MTGTARGAGSRVRILGVAVGLWAAVGSTLAREPASATAERAAFEAVLDDAYPPEGPGAAAIVVRDGEVVFRAARGRADLEHDVPLRPDMVFEIGSVSKQFTAAAILMLEKDGRLSVSDPITRFLPEFPDPSGPTSIEHLLNHTSGVASYTDIPGYMLGDVRRDLTLDELIDVFEELPREFEPGERFRYSNSGYVLLGAIVEAASGMSYEEFLDRRIFAPLGMNRSSYGSRRRVIPGRARGYEADGEAWQNARHLSMSQPHAAGAIMSTVDDLSTWGAALATDRLLPEAVRQRMAAATTLTDGSSSPYAYGLVRGEVRGREALSHGGGIFGYTSFALSLPAERIYVAVLSNAAGGSSDPSAVGRRLAAIAFGEPYPRHEAVTLTAEQLAAVTGVYAVEGGDQRTVTVDDGRLYTQRSGGARLEVRPASADRFFYLHSLTWFDVERDGDGRVVAMVMHHDGAVEGSRDERVGDAPEAEAALAVSVETLERYVGRYELAPGFVLAVTRSGEQLVAQATGQGPAELFAASETEFFLKVVDARVEFVVADDGSVGELVLRQAGQELRGRRLD